MAHSVVQGGQKSSSSFMRSEYDHYYVFWMAHSVVYLFFNQEYIGVRERAQRQVWSGGADDDDGGGYDDDDGGGGYDDDMVMTVNCRPR